MASRTLLVLGALFYANGPAAFQQRSAAKDLSKGGTILFLGDSILDCHKGESRIESVLKGLLGEKKGGASWALSNEAKGGEYIGPKEGDPKGVSGPLFREPEGRYSEVIRRHRTADAVVINYGANDGKVYPPATFRKRLETLCARLEQDYPGVMIVLMTGMYVDPAHSQPYWIDESQAPGFKNGSPRNLYLEAYNKETRELAAAKGYRIADTYRRMETETKAGTWDFRVRANSGDPEDDPKHAGDLAWFNDIHPNDRGTRLIAEVLASALLEGTK